MSGKWAVKGCLFAASRHAGSFYIGVMENLSTRSLSSCPRLARRLAALLCLATAAGAPAQTAERPSTASVPSEMATAPADRLPVQLERRLSTASMPTAVTPTPAPTPTPTPTMRLSGQPAPRLSTASASATSSASAPSPRTTATVPAQVAVSRPAAFAVAPVIELSPPAAAAPAPAGALPDGVEQQVRRLALDGTRSLVVPGDAAAGRATRVEVQIGALDPRLRLAPCQRIEAYPGVGTRWWGVTRVGLRCVLGPAHWNVFLPVTVHVHGRALVAAASLAAGSVLSAADLALAEVDLAEDASVALADGALAAGRTLQRALAAGQSLRQSHLKPRQWFAAGDTVQVLANGDGFRISGEAVALTRGIEGETARVRTESGRVLTGTPAAERRIDLPL